MTAPFQFGLVVRGQAEAGEDIARRLQETLAMVRLADRPLARLQAGDFAGELAVLGRRCHSADVVAETDLAVLECTGAELVGLLHDAPGLTRTMLSALATRLSVADRALVA